MAQTPRNMGFLPQGQLAQEPLPQGLMGALGEHATGYKCALLIPDLAPGLLPGRAEAERARPLASDHGQTACRTPGRGRGHGDVRERGQARDSDRSMDGRQMTNRADTRKPR